MCDYLGNRTKVCFGFTKKTQQMTFRPTQEKVSLSSQVVKIACSLCDKMPDSHHPYKLSL